MKKFCLPHVLVTVCICLPITTSAQVMIDPDLADWTYSLIGPCVWDWSVSSTTPSSSDTVYFYGPTNYFSNDCYAEQYFGGEPALIINGMDQTIELIFLDPTPTHCDSTNNPICGLHGSFGPLSPGTWTFYSDHPDLNFWIQVVVDGVVNTRDIIYVDSDVMTLTPNGYSWETAFSSLQQALGAAEYGSRIKIAEGRYCPIYVPDANATFKIPSGVKLEGGYQGMPGGSLPIFGLPEDRDISLYPTVLSGDILNNDGQGFTGMEDNVYHVMDISGTDANTYLSGLTIRDGFANGLDPNFLGGGLLAINSDAYITRCTFTHNVAVAGGGVASMNSNNIYDGCIFENNMALMHGGAMTAFNGTPLLLNSYLMGNQIPSDTFLGGAALSGTTTSLAIVSCTIADNRCASGGALSFFGGQLWPYSEIEINNSILFNGGREITIYDGSLIDVHYTDVQGGWWSGYGNLNVNPLFMQHGTWDVNDVWQSGDYHLQGWSPCIDAGDPTFQTVGEDIDGDPRILGQIIEMGADELLPMAPPPTP